MPSAAHQARARSATPSASAAGRQSSISSIRATGLKTWRPKNRSALPLRSPSSAIESDEVVVARLASGGSAPASVAEQLDLASVSSAIASTTRSQPARSAGSVVTFIRSGAPRSSLRAALCAPSSARQAEASLRASRRTSRWGARGEAARDHAAAGDRRALVCLGAGPIRRVTIARD